MNELNENFNTLATQLRIERLEDEVHNLNKTLYDTKLAFNNYRFDVNFFINRLEKDLFKRYGEDEIVELFKKHKIKRY